MDTLSLFPPSKNIADQLLLARSVPVRHKRLGDNVLLNSYLQFCYKWLLRWANVSLFSSEWVEINKIAKSFLSSHNPECIHFITNAIGKTTVKKKKKEKKTNIDILKIYFYAIILMFHCELYKISAIYSKYFSNHGIFEFGKRTHNKTSTYKNYCSL